jgi:uncharacterized membrane protein
VPGLYNALAVFGFSFVILVTVWYSYTTIMASVSLETRPLLVLNLVLLLVVAIEPYLLSVLAFGAPAVVEVASMLYAIDLGAMNVILGGFLHLLSRERKPLLTPQLARRMRTRRNFTWGAAALFFVTTLPIFWTWSWFGLPSRVVLWILTLPIGWAVRARTR